VISLWDNLSVSARRYPKKTALAFFDCRITYEELASAAERLAAQLAVFGVRRGDRVLVVMQNCPQLVIAHYAIFRANAVVVPVNPMNRAEELRHYITDAQATIAITTGDLAAELAAASNGIEGAANLRHLIVTQFADVIDLSEDAGTMMADFTYLLMQWIMPGLERADLQALNIPSMEEAAQIYCNYTGTALPGLNWYFAYNLFRLAGIAQGIAGRIREGTAAKPQGDRVRQAYGPARKGGLGVRAEGGRELTD